MIHRITIPDWRPTRDNELAGGSHWAKKHRLKNRDKQFIRAYAIACNVPYATGKRRVSLEITLTGRQKEADPLAYCKSLFDALVHCQQLLDDSSKFVEWGGAVYTRGESPQTTIVITDLSQE